MNYEAIQQAVLSVRAKSGFVPEIGLMLGSGLGALADRIEVELELPYRQIPGFPPSTAPGHAGRLILGVLAGRRVVAYKGRVHFYEGYGPAQVAFPVRLGFGLGASTFILTSAAGGLNPNWQAGEVMLHLDYINMMGMNPLSGPNIAELGPRFPVMFDAYDSGLLDLARRTARVQDLILREGVYLAISGPSFGSRAELRMFRNFGADVIGMSTVPEVLALRHAGARVLGLSMITDMAVGDREHHASEDEVLATAERTGVKLERLIDGILPDVGP